MQNKMHKEKLNFLKEKGICFGCLCVGHMSRDCEKRLTCTVCGQMHPSILHIQQKERTCTQEQNRPSLSSALVALQACGQTGAGNGECALSIVPVQVKSCKGQKVIQTYAFLDPGSSATFCSEHLMHRLKLKGKKTNILLKTMGNQRSVSSSILTGLEVSSLYNDIFYSLPEVFTQEKMPVSKDNMVTEEDLDKWPYLKGVKIPHIPADVDLLIGANASKVMEPWEVKNSDGEGPYAVRTLLGWVVNGPLQGSKDNGNTIECPDVTVNRYADKLEELKQELQQKGSHNRLQEEELISAMREQVLRLTQKEQVLEERLESVCQENTELRASLASLHTRLALQDQLNQQHSQQLAGALQEAEAAQGRSRQLQTQVEELQEEVSLQEGRSHGDASLLSELESSMETTSLWVSKEEITQEMWSSLQLLLPLTPKLNNSGRSEVVDQKEDLHTMLHQLKGVAQTLALTWGPQELNQAFVDRTGDQCGNPSAAHELRDQNVHLQQENAELKRKLQDVKEEEADVVQQTIRDRDEAIAKKNLMEAELVRSKSDMISLNNQLLEAIQRKLELSQELEAWQDDIQIVINQQLRSQQQMEHPQKKSTSNGTSFFRRGGRAASTSSTWSSDVDPG
ncbi:BICD family-like cargo adapter 1 [Pungitius pungitius]|uniref:BICD family-like cargo adapter 1 n=1 Tax=Pungitius pungitius TaxID=134920 RepID=UPI002E0F149B